MSLFASLPMYAFAHNASGLDRFWGLIRDQMRTRGFAAPQGLDQDALGIKHWRDPNMLLSQSCGYPYVSALREKTHVIGTFDTGLPGADPGTYYSVIIVRADDPRHNLAEFQGAEIAFNDRVSLSGYHALDHFAKGQGVELGFTLETGSHLRSIGAVISGQADIAAIDAVSFAHARHVLDLSGLRVLAKTEVWPGLPLITARSEWVDPLRAALCDAIAALGTAERDHLLIYGLVPLSRDDYVAIEDAFFD